MVNDPYGTFQIIHQYLDIFFKMVCFILDGNVFMNYTSCTKQVF